MKHVLIVDDSRAMRMIIRRTLRKLGYTNLEVSEVASGPEALMHLRTERVDVILCDWNMPEMTGMELLQTLRQEGYNQRFGFITTEVSDAMRQDATAAGASFFLSKPFTEDQFEMAVSSVLA